MPITHFEIVTLPDVSLIDTQVDGAPAVAGQKYAIALQNTVNFTRLVDFTDKSLEVPFTWRTHDEDNGVTGNETISTIKWTPDDTGLVPASANVTKTILNTDTEILLSELPLNAAVEYIEIQSIAGVNNWTLNDQPLFVGQIIPTNSMLSISYTPNEEGGGTAYAVLTYRVGKGATTEATDYTLQYDIAVAAELTLSVLSGSSDFQDEFDVPPPTTYDVTVENYNVLVEKGTPGGTANIEITITSPFLALNSWNYVKYTINGIQTEQSADGTFNEAVTLDQNGGATIAIENYIVKDVAGPYTGDIDIVLLDIDGDPGNVSATDTVEILTNIP